MVRDIYREYMNRFPHSISVFGINFEDEEFMSELLVKMSNALKNNKPLNDDIFNIPPDAYM